jgi:hypothetical protein
MTTKSIGFACRLAGAVLALAFALANRSSAATTAGTPEADSSGPPVVTVAVTLEPGTLAVGDPVAATLTLDLGVEESHREATFPDWSKGWGEAEVLQASAVEKTTSGDGTRLVQRLRLTVWKPGTIALPPIEVQLAGEPPLRAATPIELALEVRSVIAADDKELTPAPPSPPRALGVPKNFWWTVAAGGALVLAAAMLAWKRRPGFDPLAAPELSPLAELERALALLAAEPPAGAFAHLSQAFRRYLGRRLGFRALESTTTEVQRRLAGLRLDPAFVQRAVRLLRLSDQIKFARRPADRAEAAARIAEARELADAVELHMAPVAPMAPLAPGVPIGVPALSAAPPRGTSPSGDRGAA